MAPTCSNVCLFNIMYYTKEDKEKRDGPHVTAAASTSTKFLLRCREGLGSPSALSIVVLERKEVKGSAYYFHKGQARMDIKIPKAKVVLLLPFQHLY